MKQCKSLTILVCIVAAASGCSSRPRQFAPTLKAPASDAAAYQNDLATCKTLVGKGYKSNFKATAGTIGAGTVAGTAAGVASFAALGSQGILGGATTASNILGAAIPFVGFAASFGVSRAIRSGREKKVKIATGSCLKEYGYSVEGWTRIKKQKKSENNDTPKSTPVRVEPVETGPSS